MIAALVGFWLIVLGITCAIRNNLVYQELMRLMDGAKRNIGTDDFWKWMTEVERVPQLAMVFMFWVPVKSFHREWWKSNGVL